MKAERKYLGMETHFGEGVVKKEKPSRNRKPYISVSVGSFRISKGNITGKRKDTGYVPNHNYQWRKSIDTQVCQQQVGSGQGGMRCITDS